MFVIWVDCTLCSLIFFESAFVKNVGTPFKVLGWHTMLVQMIMQIILAFS